jgi:hypothetical protein
VWLLEQALLFDCWRITAELGSAMIGLGHRTVLWSLAIVRCCLNGRDELTGVEVEIRLKGGNQPAIWAGWGAIRISRS